MVFFLVWSGGTFFVLGLFCLIVWKKNPQQRFRTRLTIVFLLFVAIPTLPLTLITASLLTGSTQMLIPVQIEEALNLSLDCLKSQIAEKGTHYLNSHEGQDIWDMKALSMAGISSLSLYKIQPDSILLIQQKYGITDHPRGVYLPSASLLYQRMGYKTSSQIIQHDNQDWYCLYRSGNDSSIIVIQYPVDPELSKARERIESALSMVNTLSLIKESILQKKMIWLLATFIMSALLALTWIVSQRLSRDMTSSMRSLVSGMRQVAEGNLSYQISAKGNDEFRFIIDQFNNMILDLRTTRHRLLQAERLAAWQTVARQMSHEIKNSLTPIALSLHRMKSQLPDSSPDAQQSLKIIEEEMTIFQNMATEFSDFARMPELVHSQIQLNILIESTIKLFNHTTAIIGFHLDLDPKLPSIIADHDQIKRVLNNLIKNTVESIEQRGDIWIETRWKKEDHQIEVSIRDGGKGMDAVTMERIFEPYYTTKKRGTGLGMAMVKKIIDAHEGIIQITSKPGNGTCVRILLPVQIQSNKDSGNH